MSTEELSRRLFFALWPLAQQQARLAASAREVLRSSGGRPVAERNLHVTLAFLGRVGEARLEELTAIAQRLSAAGIASAPLQLRFEQLEYWKKAQVLCAVPASLRDAAGERGAGEGGTREGGAGEGGAGALAAALKTDLVAAGFAPDLKPFRAHVTLARKVPRRSDWRAGNAASEASRSSDLQLPAVSWSFTEFSLIESQTRADGALYSVVQSWVLSRARSD